VGATLLTIGLTIFIAWRQRIFQLRDRSADRAALEQQQQAEREERHRQEDRVARRDVWRQEYDEIRELLKRGEAIAYQIRNHGPLTAAELTAASVDAFTMEAEQLSRRGVEPLRAPLLKIAAIGQELARTAAPDDTTVVAAYQTGSPVAQALQPRSLQRLAVQQDRAAQDLTDEIDPCWQLLRDEWGI
jgi:hypothetical protein